MRPSTPSQASRRLPGVDDGRLTAWRRRHLIRAGFDPELASVVAGDCGIDLHELIGLVERGCPPSLAVRIVAPLDPPRPC